MKLQYKNDRTLHYECIVIAGVFIIAKYTMTIISLNFKKITFIIIRKVHFDDNCVTYYIYFVKYLI